MTEFMICIFIGSKINSKMKSVSLLLMLDIFKRLLEFLILDL